MSRLLKNIPIAKVNKFIILCNISYTYKENLIMSKKLLLYIIFLITFFLPFTSGAFLDGDLWTDIYNTIDEWFNDYESKIYEHEITDQWEKKIPEKVNQILEMKWLAPCIKKLDIDTIEKIRNGDVNALYNSIDEKCLSNLQEKIISTNSLFSYAGAVAEIRDTIRQQSQEKIKKIYEIARLGLYSDWDTKNSPFDLVDDIKEIEKIIFTQKIEYNWEQNDNLDNAFSDMLNGLFFWNNNGIWNWNTWNTHSGTTTSTWSVLLNNNSYPLFLAPGSYNSNYVCNNDTNTLIQESWLSEEDLNTLLQNNNSPSINNSNTWSNNQNNSWSSLYSNNRSLNTYVATWYNILNDNSIWPCNWFFCIKIEFIVHNQNLLVGWETTSIQSILTKSNGHLKKFANTSLVPSKMTTNNFEIGLMDLKLPDIFHIGVQVQKKSPPILNLDKNQENSNINNKNISEYSAEAMLEEYYKNKGLDYKKANNIQQYLWRERELKSITNSAELSYPLVIDKVSQRENAEKSAWFSEEKNDLVSKSIDKIGLFEDSNIMKQNFIEIGIFSEALRDYIFTIGAIIEQMNKIPIHKS